MGLKLKIFITTMLVMSLSLTGCKPATPTMASTDLMANITATQTVMGAIDSKHLSSQGDFAWHLFKNALAKDANSLVSPLSVTLALSMTANGAKGDTLDEMLSTLIDDASLEDLNTHLLGYQNTLKEDEDAVLKLANAIWFRDQEQELQVVPAFLEANASYYDAEIYASPFDAGTIADMNQWVKDKTDGMIEEIIEEITEDNMMYLVNALAFDAKWQKPYTDDQVYDDTFTTHLNEEAPMSFMRSEESRYLELPGATGFIKPYANNAYAFVAILPDADKDLFTFIDQLDPSDLWDALRQPQTVSVQTTMPKFSFEFDLSLVDTLKTMGMTTPFNSQFADFTGVGTARRGNLFIGEVIHKTFIAVDELGTKAGAVTRVDMVTESAPMEIKTVHLDRPFIFMIVDPTTHLPLFIGTYAFK